MAVLGNAGSGKSTLAQKLHVIFNLPVHHLDQYFWKPGWVHPNFDEYTLIHDALCDKEEWIIDGLNLRLLGYRIERADLIIFLDFPRHRCIWHIFKRTFNYYGKETPSSAAGCPERFNGEFFKFLKWVWVFKKKYRKRILELLDSHSASKQIVILRSQKDLAAYLKSLSAEKAKD